MDPAIIALIVALIGSNGFWTWWTTRGKTQAETKQLENVTWQQLSQKVKEVVTEKVKVELEKARLELQVQAQEGEITSYQNMIERILKNQGAAEERERHCQDQLNALALKVQRLEAA